MFEKYKVVWGVTPPTPFVTSFQADFASIDQTSNTRTCKYMQVLVVSLYVSKKKKFISCICPAMSTRCIAAEQLKMGSVCKVVRSDVFSSAVQQQTLRAVVLQISRLDWRLEKRLFGSDLLLNFLIIWKLNF